MSSALTVTVFRVVGSPHLGKPVTYSHDAKCGVCRRTTDVAPAGKVLTSSFGSWDDISADQSGRRWLCPACVYAFRAPELRTKATIVTGDPDSLTHPSPHDLAQRLSRAIGATEAVIVPLTRKRVVAPRAAWGKLATDYEVITWSGRDAAMLSAALRLREAGFGPRALADPSPPLTVLRGLPLNQHTRVNQLWRRLQPVRDNKARLPLYQYLTKRS